MGYSSGGGSSSVSQAIIITGESGAGKSFTTGKAHPRPHSLLQTYP